MAEEVAKCSFVIDAKNAINQLDVFGSKLGGVGNFANAARVAIGGIFAGGVFAAMRSFTNAASDAQETTQKFGVVFASVSDQAQAGVKKLVSVYNLSTHAAKTALADTGDLLSGFGFAGQAAFDLSMKVAMLGADLASFTNYAGGTQGAIEALTKALLGEREQAKMLGLAISEELVQEQMAADKKAGMRYATAAQAKAYATYAIMVRQSTNAIGDSERSASSYASNVRKLGNAVDDLKKNIGAALIEPATKIVSSISGVVSTINELDPAIVTTGTRIVALGSIVGAAGIGFLGLAGVIKTYLGVQTIATAATALKSAETVNETVGNGINEASLTSLVAAINAFTTSKIAQTAAIEANVVALNAESAAHSAGAGTNAAGSATDVADDIPYRAKGKDYTNKKVFEKSIDVPNMDDGTSPAEFLKKKKKAEKVAEQAEKLKNNPKYKDLGETFARNSAYKKIGKTKITKASDLLSVGAWLPGYKAVFGSIGKLFTKGAGIFGKFLGPIRMFAGVFGKVAIKLAGYAVPFLGWASLISTGAVLACKALKYLPKALEFVIQEVWPRVKEGFVYGLTKLAQVTLDFFEGLPQMVWNLLKGAGWGIKEVTLRLLGFETETSKAYKNNKLAKWQNEVAEKTRKLQQAEESLTKAREASTKATQKSIGAMGDKLLGVFGTDEERKRTERRNKLEEQEKKVAGLQELETTEAPKIKQKEEDRAFYGKERESAIKRKKDAEWELQTLSANMGKKLKNRVRINELEEIIADSVAAESLFGGKIERINGEIDAESKRYDASAYRKELEILTVMQAEDARETDKENQAAKARKAGTRFERGMIGAKGSNKTSILKGRAQELSLDLMDAQTRKSRQYDALEELKKYSTEKIGDKTIQELADAMVAGDGEALKTLQSRFTDLFAEIGSIVTDEELLEKEKAVKEATEAVKESEREERNISSLRKGNSHREKLNNAEKDMSIAQRVYDTLNENALKISPQDFDLGVNAYIAAIKKDADTRRAALNSELTIMEDELKATTDESRRLKFEGEIANKRHEINMLDQSTNNTIADTNKRKKETDKQRLDQALTFQKFYDDLAVSEARTGKQRIGVYANQVRRFTYLASQEQDPAKRLEYVNSMRDSFGQLQEERKKRNDLQMKDWKTITPGKSIAAESTEGASYRNRLYNTNTKSVEQNTRDLVEINKVMRNLLKTQIKTQQATEKAVNQIKNNTETEIVA